MNKNKKFQIIGILGFLICGIYFWRLIVEVGVKDLGKAFLLPFMILASLKFYKNGRATLDSGAG